MSLECSVLQTLAGRSGTSQQMTSVKTAQHSEAMAQAHKTALLEKDRELEIYQEQERMLPQDMEIIFDNERDIKYQQEFEANVLKTECQMPIIREMSQKKEEQLLRHIDQQEAKTDALRHTEKKVEKEIQRPHELELETETEDKNEIVELKKAREKQDMEEQLRTMDQNYEKVREIARQINERKWREIGEKSDEGTTELELKAEREVVQRLGLELLKCREEQKKAKAEQELQQKENDMEATRTSLEQTEVNQKLEKDREEAKAWIIENKLRKPKKEGKMAEVTAEVMEVKPEKNKGPSKQDQLTLDDTSKDLFLQDTSMCKDKLRKTDNDHEELQDDWLGGADLKKSKDKRSEIRQKHQKSREERRQALVKQLNQGKPTKTNNYTPVRQGRRVARQSDAEKQPVTTEHQGKVAEVTVVKPADGRQGARESDAEKSVTAGTTQERGDLMNLQRKEPDSLGELMQKGNKDNGMTLKVRMEMTKEKENDKNNNSLLEGNTVVNSDVMSKENHQGALTHPARVKSSRRLHQQMVQPTDNQCPNSRCRPHIKNHINHSPGPVSRPTTGLQRDTLWNQLGHSRIRDCLTISR